MIPALFALMLQAAPVAACTTTTAPPAGLEAWSIVSAVTSGPMTVGKGTALQLRPIEESKLVATPGSASKPGSFGGAYQFDIASAGTYRIALAAGAWIDVLRDGKPLESVAHTPGPQCSGIRKIVDFDLAAGRYTLQLSGAREAPMRVLIAPK